MRLFREQRNAQTLAQLAADQPKQIAALLERQAQAAAQTTPDTPAVTTEPPARKRA
jgi:hypothetical protein